MRRPREGVSSIHSHRSRTSLVTGVRSSSSSSTEHVHMSWAWAQDYRFGSLGLHLKLDLTWVQLTHCLQISHIDKVN
ncbi:hypothetical protein WN944_011586 [Citrus x changshan-huyou]|uniref:Uncharacterized protein n=1 Tax=Citrus x changshan-huyou TaxID=2935761 RepID=A0AAP0MXJ2_9ROSI